MTEPGLNSQTALHTPSIDPDEVAKFSAMAADWWNPKGKFRPLHSAPTLKRGWQLHVTDIDSLRLALETLLKLFAPFLPFSAQFARFCEWVVPDRPLAVEQDAMVNARYLDDALLDTPSLALDRTRLEALHIGEYVEAMLRDIMPAIYSGDRKRLDAVRTSDETVDRLHGQTVAYLAKISRGALSDVVDLEVPRRRAGGKVAIDQLVGPQGFAAVPPGSEQIGG